MKRFIPIITPLIIWFLAEMFLFRPSFFYLALTISLFLIVLSIKFIGKNNKKYWLLFISSPVLFLLSFFFYATIIVGNFWIQLLFLLVVWFIFLYLRSFYYYSIQKEAEIGWTEKLENLLISGSFLTAFTSAAVLFDLSAFITWPLYLMLPLWALIVFLLFIQFKPLKRSGSWLIKYLILVSVLILAELAGAFSLLPLSFNILALFLAIIYYLILMIIRLSVSGGLNRRALKLPLILSGLAILIVFLTARWL